jgi:hypothetical protein
MPGKFFGICHWKDSFGGWERVHYNMQSPGVEGLEQARCLHVLLMRRVVPQKALEAFMLWSAARSRSESWILTVKMRGHKHSEPYYYGAEKWTSPNTMKA